MKKRFQIVIILAAIVAVAAFAQEGGSITGKISDTFREPVSEASLQAKNAATGAIYKATSKRSGEYAVDRLPPGVYELSVRAASMKTFVQPDILVRTGQPIRVDITLHDDIRLSTLGDGSRFAPLKRPAPPAGPTPRMPDGKPDLSGFWSAVPGNPTRAERPQGLPWAEAVANERIANDLRDLPTARCLPNGVTATAGRGKFVQTPILLVILVEFPGDTRQVFLDGRTHPKELEPTWLGHSIGRWEGNTLVVDTVGFNDKSWLGFLFVDPYPHTEMMHVVERYRRPDLGRLELEMTVEDAGALKRPWLVKRIANLDPTDELMENICTENEKDLKHLPPK